MNTFSWVVQIAAGLVLIFAGRRVFWLAAALTAFLFVFNVLQNWLGNSLVGFIIAAVIGLVIAGVAIRFVKAIGFLIGALAGAVGLPILLGLLHVTWPWWIIALIGAVIGIIIVSLAFNVGLVVMTAWLGANAVTGGLQQVFTAGSSIFGLLFITLLIIGIVVQMGQIGGRRG